jgi:hypothetical protein
LFLLPTTLRRLMAGWFDPLLRYGRRSGRWRAEFLHGRAGWLSARLRRRCTKLLNRLTWRLDTGYGHLANRRWRGHPDLRGRSRRFGLAHDLRQLTWREIFLTLHAPRFTHFATLLLFLRLQHRARLTFFGSHLGHGNLTTHRGRSRLWRATAHLHVGALLRRTAEGLATLHFSGILRGNPGGIRSRRGYFATNRCGGRVAWWPAALHIRLPFAVATGPATTAFGRRSLPDIRRRLANVRRYNLTTLGNSSGRSIKRPTSVFDTRPLVGGTTPAVTTPLAFSRVPCLRHGLTKARTILIALHRFGARHPTFLSVRPLAVNIAARPVDRVPSFVVVRTNGTLSRRQPIGIRRTAGQRRTPQFRAILMANFA